MAVELTSAEHEQLHGALLRSTTGYDDLGRIVRKAGPRIQDVTAPAAMPKVVTDVIEYFESRDQVSALVAAARAANPHNGTLFTVALALGVEPGFPGISRGGADEALGQVTGRLERMVDRERGIADLGVFAARSQEWLRQVCRIEIGSHRGTGFLIGPSTVLTNFHVVEKLVEGELAPGEVELRFDHHRLRDGVGVSSGVVHHLAHDWLVCSSRYSARDEQTYDDSRPPAPDELDYAILRLDGSAGEEMVTRTGSRRGWLVPRRAPWQFEPDTFLLVAQHPCGDPIAFDSAPDAVLRLASNGTRVHYRINTLPGSSGSPVFNRALELVALHHSGEPGAPDHFLPCHSQVSLADYNEGIPIGAIVTHARQQGAGWAFADVEGAAHTGSDERRLAPGAENEAVTVGSRQPSLKDPRATNRPPSRLGPVAASHPQAALGHAPPPTAPLQPNAPSTPGAVRARFERKVEPDPLRGSRPPADAARRAALLDVQRSAVQVLKELRELMDRALDEFASADAADQSAISRDLTPEAYVNEVNSLAQDIEEEVWGDADAQRLLDLLHVVVANVMVGIEVSERAGALGVVADLSKKAGDAYSTVGEQLQGELGGVLVRVAPYWRMKSAFALHQRNEQKQRQRLAQQRAGADRAPGGRNPSRRTG